MSDTRQTLSNSRPTTAELREMLAKMLLIRAFETRAAEDYAEGRIFGAMHSYIGEEAVAVGICSALTKADQIISTHRGHGHCIAKGADVNRMFAELYGRADGYCKGKGGSMHIADFSIGMLGANGIVAGGISIISGAGLAAKMDGFGRVAVSFFGDGAANAGPFHECLNIASAWKLPMLFVCENNLYAANTSASVTHGRLDIAAKAAGYGMPSVVVDGNDVLAVRAAADAAILRAKAGEGPTLIEARTYRWRPHSERKSFADQRDPAERAAWMARDPIAALAEAVLELTPEDFAGLKAAAEAAVRRAVTFAEASPLPSIATLTDDMFAEDCDA